MGKTGKDDVAKFMPLDSAPRDKLGRLGVYRYSRPKRIAIIILLSKKDEFDINIFLLHRSRSNKEQKYGI